MILIDRHVHTTFSDGAQTPEEMVRAAVEKGMKTIGFSDHSYTFFDESYCMKKADIPAYKNCIAQLKEKYKDQIEILCGIEQDFYSKEPAEGYDYIIASVHYIKLGEEYVPVDETPEDLVNAAERFFDGDIYAVAETYFDTVAKIKEADIIGHIDLITKFQGIRPLFDTAHPRYMAAARRAADALLRLGVPFEINTSPLYRKAKTDPYPETPLMEYIRDRGGKFVLSGDCHCKEMLCFSFEKYKNV